MLHHAVNVDHLSIPRLIAAGVDPNARDYSGSTALLRASFQKHKTPELFLLPLLNAGADINAIDNAGRTPLSVAVTVGDSLNTIRFLIQHGAELERPDALIDAQPLITAVVFQQSEYLDVLIEAGAKCSVVGENGCGIMHHVGKRADIATLEVLKKWRRKLAVLDLDRKDILRSTALDYGEKRDDVSPEWLEVFASLVDHILDLQDANLEEERFKAAEDEGYETGIDVFEDALEVQEEPVAISIIS